jgi:hypothetical protein
MTSAPSHVGVVLHTPAGARLYSPKQRGVILRYKHTLQVLHSNYMFQLFHKYLYNILF